MRDIIETRNYDGKEFNVFSYITMDRGGELLVFTDCCRDIFEQMGFNMNTVAKMVETSMGEEIGWVIPKDDIMNLCGGIIVPKKIYNLPWGGCIGESLELITEYELIGDTKIKDMMEFIKSYGLFYLPCHRNIMHLDSTGLHSQESISFVCKITNENEVFPFIKYNGNYYDSSAITDEYQIHKLQTIPFNDKEKDMIVDCIAGILVNGEGLNDLPNDCVTLPTEGKVLSTSKFIMCNTEVVNETTGDITKKYQLTISPTYTYDNEEVSINTYTDTELSYLDKLWDKLDRIKNKSNENQ